MRLKKTKSKTKNRFKYYEFAITLLLFEPNRQFIEEMLKPISLRFPEEKKSESAMIISFLIDTCDSIGVQKRK